MNAGSQRSRGSRRIWSLCLLACACSPDTVAPAPQAPPTPDPAWFADFADRDARLAFLAEVERSFRAKGLIPELQADGAMQVRGGKSGTQEFELSELAANCAHRPRAEWATAIADHLARVIAMRDALDSVRVLAWKDAQPRLRLGLQPDSYLAEAGYRSEEVASAVDLPGLVTLAFVDDPQVAVVVTNSSLDPWKQAPVVALGLARSNTREALRKELKVEEQDVGELGKLWAITADSWYTASAVLWLEYWPQTLGEHGAIVILPTRESVFVWPFDDARVTRVIPALRSFAQSAAQRMGHVLDEGVFWRRPDGSFERIRFETNDGKL